MMSSLFAPLTIVLAQAAPAPGSGSAFNQLLPFLPLPFLFYFLIWRPKQQEERRRQDMLRALKKNDKVLTAAGIYGTVVSVDDEQDRVLVRVDDDRGVRIPFTRGRIVRIFDGSPEKGVERATESATK